MPDSAARRRWWARRLSVASLALLARGAVALPLPIAPPLPLPTEQPAPTPQPADHPEGEPADTEDHTWPKLDVYIPEGELDLRLDRSLRNAFFEGQVKYNFVKGDITAFLRYRYYGYRRTYRLALFDAVEFPGVEKLSNDFFRTRGTLLLVQQPWDYYSRSFLLAELDRISSNKRELAFTTNRTNTFIRLGHQIGTPDDSRSNAIVGESRAEVAQVLTAHRRIGPWGAGLTGAATWGFDYLGGDFSYLKLEAEGLKRFDLPLRRSFVIARLHAGAFPAKHRVRETDPEAFAGDQYAIPQPELFRLDGRNAMKGLAGHRRGTEELHATTELFVPWFAGEDRRALRLRWQEFYGVLYTGAGSVGFDRSIYRRFGDYALDAGIGFEAAARLRNYSFFLTGIVAGTIRPSGHVEAQLSVKSYH
ncbi:MAG TPA: hypothetical protein VGS57_06080 [Thermoanaerobaculia bacterium]|nr:hypothetical protein [Thermoanaerobaculia bacterium]